MTAPPNSKREELLALAARCEAATGPDRRLDAMIGAVVGVEPKERNVYRRGHFIGNNPVLLRIAQDYPKFTTSLDAALSLVPDGAHIGMGADAIDPLRGWAWVRVRSAGTWEEFHSPERDGLAPLEPMPRNIATALTAACLRALAAMEDA